MKRKPMPHQDPETKEWRYNSKWWDYYPSEEIEADEAALDEYWERERDSRRDKAMP